jgi:hypothetical protein
MAYLGEARIEDSVRNLVTDLVRVSLSDRLRGEQEAVLQPE